MEELASAPGELPILLEVTSFVPYFIMSTIFGQYTNRDNVKEWYSLTAVIGDG
jgi:hypothetical protein